jgi:hypothetical protein
VVTTQIGVWLPQALWFEGDHRDFYHTPLPTLIVCRIDVCLERTNGSSPAVTTKETECFPKQNHFCGTLNEKQNQISCDRSDFVIHLKLPGNEFVLDNILSLLL